MKKTLADMGNRMWHGLSAFLFERSGGIRLAWMLSAVFASLVGSMLLIRLLCVMGYQAALSAWGVTDRNVSRASGLIRWTIENADSLFLMLQSTLLIGVAILLRRAFRISRPALAVGSRFLWARGALLGGLSMGILWGLLLAFDLARLGWRLTRPAWSFAQATMALSCIAQAAAETAWTLGLMWCLLETSITKKGLLCAVYAICFAAMESILYGFSPYALLNGMLMGLIMRALFRRADTLAAPLAFRAAWMLLDRVVFGLPGSDGAIYETYPVKWYWLSGGESGVRCGLAATVLLALLLASLMKEWRVGRKR